MLKILSRISFLKAKIILFAFYTIIVFGAGAYFQSGKQAKKEVKLHNKALKVHDKQLDKDEKIIKKAIDKHTELNKLKEVAHAKIHLANSRNLITPGFASLYNQTVKSANSP